KLRDRHPGEDLVVLDKEDPHAGLGSPASTEATRRRRSPDSAVGSSGRRCRASASSSPQAQRIICDAASRLTRRWYSIAAAREGTAYERKGSPCPGASRRTSSRP